MIDSMEKLYDHANRFRPAGRWNGKEGTLSIYGGGGVAIHVDRPEKRRRYDVHPLPDACLLPESGQLLELRRAGDGEWVPVTEYDEEEVAARVTRFSALSHYEVLVNNYVRLVDSLRQATEDMHPDDREEFALPEFPTLKPYTDEYREAIR